MQDRVVKDFINIPQVDFWALSMLRQGTLDEASDEHAALEQFFLRLTQSRDHHSSRIKMYLQFAANAKGKVFSEIDKAFLQRCALSLQGQYFIEYRVDEINRYFTKMFTNGRRWLYLFYNQYRQKIANIIIGWARAGLLNHQDDRKGKELSALIAQLNEEPDSYEWRAKVNSTAFDTDMISSFFSYYVDKRGWQPWFQVVPDEHYQGHALIELACRHHAMNVKVCQRSESGSNDMKISELFSDQTAENLDQKTLHLLYDKENNHVTILEPVINPSRLYKMLALRESHAALQSNPYHEAALQVVSRYGSTAFLIMAQALSDDVNSKPEHMLLVKNGLDTFITHYNHKNHEGRCRDDKDTAQEVKQKLEGRLANSFFSVKNLITVAEVAIAVTTGIAVARYK